MRISSTLPVFDLGLRIQFCAYRRSRQPPTRPFKSSTLSLVTATVGTPGAERVATGPHRLLLGEGLLAGSASQTYSAAPSPNPRMSNRGIEFRERVG